MEKNLLLIIVIWCIVFIDIAVAVLGRRNLSNKRLSDEKRLQLTKNRLEGGEYIELARYTCL